MAIIEKLAVVTFKRRKAFWELIASRTSLLWWEVEDLLKYVCVFMLCVVAIFGTSWTLCYLFQGNVIFDGMCTSFLFGATLYWIADILRTWSTSSFTSRVFYLYLIILFSMLWIDQVQYFQTVHVLGLDYKMIGG